MESLDHGARTTGVQDDNVDMGDPLDRANSPLAQQTKTTDAAADNDDDTGGDDDSNEEEEYEIEDILGHELRNVSSLRVFSYPVMSLTRACRASLLRFV